MARYAIKCLRNLTLLQVKIGLNQRLQDPLAKSKYSAGDKSQCDIGEVISIAMLANFNIDRHQQIKVICCDEDTADLQDDLYRLEDWQQKWQMEFNPSKCKIMCFTTRRDPPKREYVFCGEIPEEVERHPYLGVMLDNKRRWSPHVETITSKAKKVLELIKRNLWNCPKTVKETSYKTLVKPKL